MGWYKFAKHDAKHEYVHNVVKGKTKPLCCSLIAIPFGHGAHTHALHHALQIYTIGNTYDHLGIFCKHWEYFRNFVRILLEMAEPYENVIVVNIWMYPILRTINDLPSNKKYLLYLSLLPTLFFCLYLFI